MLKKKRIVFLPASEEIQKFVDPPEPARKNIPEWYKSAQTDYLKNPIFNDRGRLSNVSVKQCMPFLDSLTAGYIQKTWCDIYIKQTPNGGLDVITSTKPDVLGMRDIPSTKTWKDEYYGNEFFWKVPYQPVVPKGYSVLVTHPMNRNDLPFTTLSGVIDSDQYFHGPMGNLPFYLKNNFSGMIPKGTPMFQYLPFKRDSWKMTAEGYSDKIDFLERLQIQKFWGFYKDNFWNRKDYS